MSLQAWINDGLESLGLNGEEVRPINEGEQVTVVEPQESKDSFWDFLDDIGTTVKNGVADIATGYVQEQIDKLTYGPEAAPDTTGNPSDQAGAVVGNPAVQADQPFYLKYKKELLIGAGVLASVVIVKKVL